MTKRKKNKDWKQSIDNIYMYDLKWYKCCDIRSAKLKQIWLKRWKITRWCKQSGNITLVV